MEQKDDTNNKPLRTLRANELLMYSTVRIETVGCDNETCTGTGFFYKVDLLEDRVVPVIITNKHVVSDAKHCKFHMSVDDDNRLPCTHFSVEYEDVRRAILNHPDPEVDLCMIDLSPLIRMLENRTQKVFFKFLDKSFLPDDASLDKLTAIEDIIMIGYPNGIWDRKNNMPICRKGITATHPAINYEGRDEFMIDAACFPGSSGSPVFLMGRNLQRTKLLGVLYSGPQHTATGELQVIQVPTRQEILAISRIPNNLGLVIKSKKLLDFVPIIQGMINSKKQL